MLEKFVLWFRKNSSAKESGSNSARTYEAGETVTGQHGIELVWCPPGTFVRALDGFFQGLEGSNETQHQVTLTRGFWIGKYPVTQTQWEAVMGENPSEFKGHDNPVENVAWKDAKQFLAKLGASYRLPFESEWEFAARAGTTTAYCFGDDPAELGDYAWFKDNAGEKTHPVGQKKPNAWGIHDMHGNVWEWCQDWFGNYPADPVTDPFGPLFGTYRVSRGGGWTRPPVLCRSSSREAMPPDSRSSVQGFRVAADSIF